MIRRTTLLILLALCLLPAAANAKGMSIYLDGPTDAQLAWVVESGGNIEAIEENGRIQAFIPAAMEPALSTRGIPYDIRVADTAAYAKANFAQRLSVSGEKENITLDHFLSHEEMESFLTQLQSAHPQIMSIDTTYKTTGGLQLFLVKISDNAATDENEPELFFEGNIHGDEIAGYTLSLHMIQYLVENYDSDPRIKELVDGREIFFLPASNSDGCFSRRRVRYNLNGVDLNRDNGYMWHAYGGSPGPYSQHESRNYFSIIQANQFVFMSSHHSGDLGVSLPWSYNFKTPPDWAEHDFLGEGYCLPNEMQNEWFQGSEGMYQMNGSTKDAAYGSMGAMAWTVELTYIKQIPWGFAQPMLDANRESILWLIEVAGAGLSGTITDADTGQPLAAVIDIDGRTAAYSDPEIGDLHRFLLPGTYDLTIWANGYLPVRLEGVVVGEKGSTDISTSLSKDSQAGQWAWRWLFNFGSNDLDSELPTKAALGPPDGQFYSIGFSEKQFFADDIQAHAVLDLGPEGIEDGPGDDLFIHEGGDDGDEPIRVFAATSPFPETWTLLGQGQGDISFDLAATELDWVRYVRIEDTQPAIRRNHATQTDGYDLDAIGRPYSIDEPDDDDDAVGDDDETDDDTDDDAAASTDDDDNDDNGCCG